MQQTAGAEAAAADVAHVVVVAQAEVGQCLELDRAEQVVLGGRPDPGAVVVGSG